MPAGSTIVLFHSVLGLRPAVLQWAARLRDAGHTVHTPDLYDGEVFDDPSGAADKIEQLGFDELLARGRRARPGARGAILMHAPLPIRALGWEDWPATVPVQVHFAEKDPLRHQPVIDALAAKVRQSGARFEQHDYPGRGHLFADPGRPGYSAAAADQMLARTLAFLAT